MATYQELRDIARNDSKLQEQVEVAVAVAAVAVFTDATPPANQAARLVWAARALENPVRERTRMLPYLLAANAALTPAQIAAATDAAVQTRVDEAVDLFADNPAPAV